MIDSSKLEPLFDQEACRKAVAERARDLAGSPVKLPDAIAELIAIGFEAGMKGGAK
ncbi:hypothetical protein [Caballeronia sp. LZ035]|uniref:hypothetical protein n=1 Tax=Caballeronia sp. LZ035 TaxID=3038568 RepID=UPI0028555CCF|nr:hypothetical protein [Caballeronia sp. LZ035]MDR5761941.1 hypothetical protein [Caballeronia sp. LZ035]